MRNPTLLAALCGMAVAGGAEAQEQGPVPERGLDKSVLEQYLQSDRAKARLETFQDKYPLSSLDETDLRLLQVTGRDRQLSSLFAVSTLDLIRQLREDRIYWDVASKIRDPYADKLGETLVAPPSAASTVSDFAAVEALKKVYPWAEMLSLRLAANEQVLLVRSGVPANTPPPVVGSIPIMSPVGAALLTPEGRIDELYWPKGFPEVGVLTLDGKAHCTATLIRRDVALTAAPCVIERAPDGVAAVKTNASRLAFYPEVPEGNDTFQTRVRPPSQGRRIEKRIRRGVTAVETRGAGSFDDQIRQDMAIVRLTPTDGQPVWAKLAEPAELPSTLPFDVTFAGYGAPAADGEIGAELHIGWQKVDYRLPTTIAWSAGFQPRLSTTCSGDSGGPVFLGAYRGAIGEARKVVAVISVRDCYPGGRHLPRATAAYLDAASWTWATTALARIDGETSRQLAARAH